MNKKLDYLIHYIDLTIYCVLGKIRSCQLIL